MAREERRLAAIVSADVVGYSRLMGVDESGTLAAMRAHRAELYARIRTDRRRLLANTLLSEFN